MPKESFEQFVKRQGEKLDKAEKIVEGVKERWKGEKERFIEIVEKSVKKLKKLWEEIEKETEEEIVKKIGEITPSRIFSFLSSLPLPEIPPFLLERTSNKFLKEFDREKFEERDYYLRSKLGLFLSAFLKKNIENYILSQKRKGIKEEEIKPIEVHLNVKELPIVLDFLGYRNPEKLYLIIEGDCGRVIGEEMQGGEIIIEGDCEDGAGWSMQGGEIIIEGNCEDVTGWQMEGGELNIKGEVESFDKSAFSPNNKGTIIWKGIKIWENGDWTKEGKEMWEKGEIPVE